MIGPKSPNTSRVQVVEKRLATNPAWRCSASMSAAHRKKTHHLQGEAAFMAKGFGVAALVFALIAIFTPFGIFVSAIAIIFAVISALAGDRIFATATALIALINTFFFSPSTWVL